MHLSAYYEDATSCLKGPYDKSEESVVLLDGILNGTAVGHNGKSNARGARYPLGYNGHQHCMVGVKNG